MHLVLTPRSAAARRSAPSPRFVADTLDVKLRIWIELGAAFLPFLAWLMAGISDSPKLAFAAYLVVGGLLVVRLHLGYLALIPMLPFFHAQGFPPHGPIVLLCGIALGSVIVRSFLGTVRIPRPVRPALWSSLAFLALTAFQLLLGVRDLGGIIPLTALSQFDQVFIVLSVFATGLVVLPGRALAPFHLAYLASLAIVAAIAILNFIEPHWLKVLGLAWTIPPNAFENRASGVIANPNSLGLALACGLSWILVTTVWQLARGRIERVTWLASLIPLTGLTLLLTFSRAAIIAVGVGTIAALARRSLRAAAILAGGAAIAIILVYPIFVQVRLGQTFGQASPEGESALADSDRLRTLMAVSAVKAFIDAPIAGHGFATFSVISPTYSGQSTLTSAHDMYLKVLAEQGLIGLSMLGILVISMVVPMWRAGPGPWMASLAVVGAFLTFSFTGDSLGSAQAVSGAFFLIAAGVAEAGAARERDLAAMGADRRVRSNWDEED